MVIFEKSAQIGGVWKYEDTTHIDSSMYQSLRTNLPTSVMQLSGFPFPPGPRSFVQHTDVLKYIQDYAKHYSVVEAVRYNTKVVAISKNVSGTDHAWKVDVESSEVGSYSEQFDKIVICNGHFAVPFYAPINGAENFHGETLHSHDYRVPGPFKNKSVLLVGCGPSGQDISLELVRAGARRVTVAFKESGERPAQPNDQRVLKPVIDCIRHDGSVLFMDGSVEEAPDVLMYCTGYLYTATALVPPGTLYPQLAPPDNLDLFPQDRLEELLEATKAGSVIAPLYRQLFSIEEPDLVFIGLPFKNLPFLCFEVQAKWAARVFSGERALPAKRQMYETFLHELDTLPFPMRKLHQLGSERQKAYFEELASYSDTKCDPVVQAMFEDAGFLRATYPLGYRSAQYTQTHGQWMRRFVVEGDDGQSAQELVRVFE